MPLAFFSARRSATVRLGHVGVTLWPLLPRGRSCSEMTGEQEMASSPTPSVWPSIHLPTPSQPPPPPPPLPETHPSYRTGACSKKTSFTKTASG